MLAPCCSKIPSFCRNAAQPDWPSLSLAQWLSGERLMFRESWQWELSRRPACFPQPCKPRGGQPCFPTAPQRAARPTAGRAPYPVVSPRANVHLQRRC